MWLSPSTTAQPESPISAAYGLLDGWAGEAPVLDLGQAAPPYGPAGSVVEHVVASARAPGGSAYLGGAGLPRLREVFAAELGARYGGDVHPDDVVVTAGCNQAFCLVMTALAEPGDEVVVVPPVYFNHTMWLRMQGIRPVLLEPDADLLPDAARADELIGDRTRAIVVVTPGNPTGVTVPPERLAALAQVARRRGVALVLDETYRSFRPEPEAPGHALFDDPDWREHVVSLHSFSKDLAIPGYRVGAVVGAPALGREVCKALDCVAIGAPRVGQEAAWAGLTTAGAWRDERVREIAERRARFTAVMAGRPGGFEQISCGAFFAWVRHPFAAATHDVVRGLAHRHGVLVIPGTAFESEDRATLRVSVSSLDDERLGDLVERLTAAGGGGDPP